MRNVLGLFVLSLGLVAAAELKVEVKPVPKEVKADVDVPFQVIVTDAKGAPVAGAEVVVTVTMVEMDHGTTKLSGKAVKPGVYEVKPNFMMGGAWNLKVDVSKGADKATLNKKVDVKD